MKYSLKASIVFCLFLFFVSIGHAYEFTMCQENGGDKLCIQPTPTAFSYGKCDPYLEYNNCRPRDWCRIIGGEAGDSCYKLSCTGAVTPTTEEGYYNALKEFFGVDQGGECPAHFEDNGWMVEGESIYRTCGWNATETPRFENGIEIHGAKRLPVKDCDGNLEVTPWMYRNRSLVCPQGFTKYYSDDETESICAGEPCPDGYSYNMQTQQCELICEEDEYAYQGECYLEGHCPIGFAYSEEQKCQKAPEDTGLQCNIPSKGNPINTAQGNKFQVETDFTASGSFPLSFTRYYNSNSLDDDITMGKKWSHTYNRKIVPLVELLDNSVQTGFNLIRHDGRNIKFPLTAGQSTDLPAVLSDEQTTDDGLVRTVTYINGLVETYLMSLDEATNSNSIGRLISIKSPSGQVQTLAYNDDNLLESVSDNYNNSIGFTYYDNNQLQTFTDTTNQVYTYTYVDQKLESVIYPDNTPEDSEDNPTKTYHYENANFPLALTGITNEENVRYATWEYDSEGRAYISKHAGDSGIDLTEIIFNDDGSRTVKNPLGKETTYHFETVNDNLRVDYVEGHPSTSCMGANRDYTYSDNGFIETKTDWKNNTTFYIRDDMGRVKSKTIGYGTEDAQTTETDYHSTYNKPEQVRSYNGGDNQSTLIKIVDIVYYGDEAGEEFWAGLVKSRTVTDPQTAESRTISYTYYGEGENGAKQLKTVNGARTDVDDITTYTYNADGTLKTTENALGHTSTVVEHDDAGRPKVIHDENMVETVIDYTPRGWIENIRRNGGDTHYDYYDTGLIKLVTAPDNTTLEYIYDDANRLTDIFDKQGNTIHYVLNNMGGIETQEIKDPDGIITKTQSTIFDELNRVKHTIGADPNQDIETTYDANGNVDYSTDAYDKVTDNSHDPLNRLRQTQDTAQGITQIRYDDYNNVYEIEDPRNLITRYTYNALGDLKELNSPDTGITTYTYDSAGNLKTKKDARNITVNYVYDALNRITDVIYPDASENIHYGYDENNDDIFSAFGKLTSITDASGSTLYKYYPSGKIWEETRVIDGATYKLSYQYNLADKLTHIIYPSELDVEYIYDTYGHLTTVTATKDGNTTTLAQNIKYKPFGPQAELRFGNGLLKTNNYDLNYRLDTSTTGDILSLDFGYDYMSNIETIDNLLNSMEDQTFTLDDLYRLDTAEGNYSGVTLIDYDLDATGNRETKNTDAYIIDPNSNRIDSITTAEGTISFGYDDAGNTTTKGDWTFTYNQRGRLETAEANSQTTSFQYSALGQRTTKTTADKTTHFIYNTGAQLLMEKEGDITKEYIYLGGQVLASYTQDAEEQTQAAPASFQGACPFNTATVQEHVDAGRAYSETTTTGGWWWMPGEETTTYYAQGSGENLGTNSAATVTLYQGNDDNQYQTDPNDCGEPIGDPCPAFTALNSEHVTANRAYTETTTTQGWWWLPGETITTWYAQGSNENLGTTDTTTTLYQSQDGTYQTTDPQNCIYETPIYTGFAYYHNDHLGMPRVVTAENGDILWKGNHTPYGEVAEENFENAEGEVYTQNIRFPGQYHDRETDLYYNYFRYYDFSIGRYITSDPIGLDGGINTYAYVNGNPLGSVDPLGLESFCQAVCVVAQDYENNPLVNGSSFDTDMLADEVVPSGGHGIKDMHFTDMKQGNDYDIQYVQVGWSIESTYGSGSAEIFHSGYLLGPLISFDWDHFDEENMNANWLGLHYGAHGVHRSSNFEDWAEQTCQCAGNATFGSSESFEGSCAIW